MIDFFVEVLCAGPPDGGWRRGARATLQDRVAAAVDWVVAVAFLAYAGTVAESVEAALMAMIAAAVVVAGFFLRVSALRMRRVLGPARVGGSRGYWAALRLIIETVRWCLLPMAVWLIAGLGAEAGTVALPLVFVLFGLLGIVGRLTIFAEGIGDEGP